jgi:hypothetical protein
MRMSYQARTSPRHTDTLRQQEETHETTNELAFLIALRETPVRASSRCCVMASCGTVSQRGVKGISAGVP